MKKGYLAAYYLIAKHLPSMQTPIVGRLSNCFRVWYCRHLFVYCGEGVNIQPRVYLANMS